MPDYFETGFFVREAAWHRMGTVLDDYPGREEGIVLAGHDFEIIEAPIYLPGPALDIPAESNLGTVLGEHGGAVNLDGQLHAMRGVPTHKALIKDMPHETRPDDVEPGDFTPTHGKLMAVVNDSYGVIQNSVGWDIIDALVGEGVKYETAGVLKGGAVCWVLAYLDEPYTIPGDDSVILPYVNVAWSHDGSSALAARPTTVRVVCWNTQSAAEAEGRRNSNEFTFRHSKNVMDRIEDAKMAIKGIRGAHQEYIELAETLAKVPVTEEQRETFVTEFIPMPAEALISPRVKANIEKDRAALRLLFSDESLTVPEPHRLTGYGLHMAGVEFLDHLRGYRSNDTLFGRQLLRNEPAKAKLTSLIMEVAEVA
jgi:phage/plasmid-like protein (TIGR03299 family)